MAPLNRDASLDASASPWAWRLRVYPAVIVAVIFIVVVLAAVFDAGTTGPDRHLGGDYPAFYGAGSLARDGAWDDLYDARAQQEAQTGLIDEGALLYFAYPPPVAAAYAPLAAVDYRWSYLVHTALMALALWGAVVLARPIHSTVDRYPVAVYAGLLLTFPLFRAVTGGQNTALTLLLIVAAARFDRDGRWLMAGLAVGLMLYKPQFGVVFAALLVVRRRWRAVSAAAGIASAMWVASAIIVGPGWLPDWISKARDFADLNADLNSGNFASIPGALNHAFGGLGAGIGWALAGSATAIVAWIWWRYRNGDPIALYALTAAAVVLVLPQPLFYEVGLVALLGLVATEVRLTGIVVVALAAASWIQAFSGSLGGIPSMVIAVTALAFAAPALLQRLTGEQAVIPLAR